MPYSKLPPVASFPVTSTDVEPGRRLAAEQHSAVFGVPGGADVSPQLAWSGAPAGTRSFAVTVFDPDAPIPSGFWHWGLVDIPGDVRELPAGAGSPDAELPGAAFHLPSEDDHRRLGGDPNIRLWLGTWRLAPDEALVVEATPPKCHYWNFQLGNVWAESLDQRFQRVHINSSQAAYRDDGSFELAVAHRDPGHPNWISTAGHEHGTMGLRWVLAESHPEPRTRVAKLAAL